MYISKESGHLLPACLSSFSATSFPSTETSWSSMKVCPAGIIWGDVDGVNDAYFSFLKQRFAYGRHGRSEPMSKKRGRNKSSPQIPY